MKLLNKLLFIGLLCLIGLSTASGQANWLDVAPNLATKLSSQAMNPHFPTQIAQKNAPNLVIGGGNNGGGMQTQAMWDFQFYHNLTATSTYGSLVGMAWTGTEYWVSKWTGPDSLFRFDGTGAFLGVLKITGMGAVRGMTTDGTSVYVANNSATIRKISIATQAITATFTVPATAFGTNGATRWISYDPSSGGGFWIGNFNTDFVRINNPASGTATIQTSIPAATHGITGMYGAVYDAVSLGGPYMWVFSQTDPTGGYSTATLNQVSMPAGTFTGNSLDINTFVGILPNNGALAGGISIGTGIPNTTQPTLLCMIQGVGMIGLELNYPANDVLAKSVEPVNGLTMSPNSQNAPMQYQNQLRSIGNAATNGVTSLVNIYDGAATLQTTLNATSANIPKWTTLTKVASSSFTPPAGNGLYYAEGIQSFSDPVEYNDTTYSYLVINDSIMAKDYAQDTNVVVGSIGIGPAGGTDKKLGQIFPLAVADALTSITMYFSAPRLNNSVSMSVYSVSGGLPANVIGNTASYSFVPADTANGKWLTLKLLGGPLNLPAGDFFVCVNEGDSLCGIAVTERIFLPGKHFITASAVTSGLWQDLATFAPRFHRALVIRPNFGNTCPNINVSTFAQPSNCGQSNGSASVTPTGGVSPYTYTWNTTPPQYTSLAVNLPFGSYTCTIKDANACPSTATVNVTNQGAPTATITPTNPLCAGQTGSAVASATGGSGSYTYTWSNGTIGASANGLTAGTAYTVTVKDGNNCISTSTVTLTAPSPVTGNAQASPTSCATSSNGSATAIGAGGTGPYTYTWSNGAIGATANNLPGGAITVTIKDSKGCTTTATATVTSPSAISVGTSSTPSSGSNGTATATPSGGTPPFTYQWNTTPPQTTATATGLGAGSYTVTVTDSKGCTQQATVTIIDVGIELSDKGITSLSLSPNPNQGVFTLAIQFAGKEDVQLAVIDMAGKTCYESVQNGVNEIVQEIDLQSLSAGVYLLTVQTAKGVTHLKMIVE